MAELEVCLQCRVRSTVLPILSACKYGFCKKNTYVHVRFHFGRSETPEFTCGHPTQKSHRASHLRFIKLLSRFSRFACGENAIYSEPSPSSLSLRRPLQLMGFVLTKLISPITRWLPLTKRPQKKGKRVICSADITFIRIGGSNNIVNQIPEWILFSV